MALSYSAGRAKVLQIAEQQSTYRRIGQDNVPLHDTIGGIAAEDVISPKSIPEYDTSAMDGYAVHSQATAAASEQAPVTFKTNTNLCVEIMTGAIFPDGYDACVKIEDTVLVDSPAGRHILITKPVAQNANRRFAGSDILSGDVVVKQGEAVRPSHILPLASIGFDSIPLAQKPRVGIWSTGKEMINGKGATRDANGPYLTAAVREMGLHGAFLGVLGDDPAGLHDHVRAAVGSREYDLLITSGAVSKGRFDHVRDVLDKMGAEIVFHGLAIRPGHPVLFALIPGVKGRTAFFGLPGNPGAAAACFRFLAVPYLRVLQGRAMERPILARVLRQPETSKAKHGCHSMQNTDCFRHGVLSTSVTGQLIVEPSAEQSPAKLGPFITANCWIHFRPDHPPGPGATDLVECYPISSTGTIHLSTSLLN
ncbi:MoeA, N-terminal and linker domain-containing protein [Chaetomidium leptoderma]|uniref:molybdopterin adenylyltransferase n=1 Tax=Chaetomidium leptoderma TaxID=669021 RepID=A0AAN6VE61_9PEZI|nr:MoeA, N-terminal and linker domain-containing protein [Chaetomidium leptoderma]